MNRDEMGIIRTHLANERTLLAYVRTALAFVAAGAGMIHFFLSPVLRSAGWLLLVCGCMIFLVGAGRFMRMRRRIGKLPSRPESVQEE
jgi:putative membrane protein